MAVHKVISLGAAKVEAPLVKTTAAEVTTTTDTYTKAALGDVISTEVTML